MDLGVYVDCSFFTHGDYDWVLCVKSKNILNVKKFIERFNNLFRENVEDISILDIIFPVEIHGIQNPNIEEFKNYF